MAKKNPESDSTYILKLVLYLIVGSQWLKVTTKNGTQVPIPIGAMVALMFALHEHFMIDRKVEYALILIAMFIGFWVPVGLVLEFN